MRGAKAMGMGGGPMKNLSSKNPISKIEDAEYFQDLFAKIEKNKEELGIVPVEKCNVRKSVCARVKNNSCGEHFPSGRGSDLKPKISLREKDNIKQRNSERLTKQRSTGNKKGSGECEKTLFGMMREDFRDPFENAKETRLMFSQLGVVNFIALALSLASFTVNIFSYDREYNEIYDTSLYFS